MSTVLVGYTVPNADGFWGGHSVRLDAKARPQHVYVIGATGTGKSNLLEHIAHEDMDQGEGLCFLDPHGDSAEKLLAAVPAHREGDVIYWDPADWEYPFGLNPFYLEDKNPRAIAARADNFIAALGSLAEFSDIFTSAPRMKNILHQMALAFVVNYGFTLTDTVRFLTDTTYRHLFYPALRAYFRPVQEFWLRFDELPARDKREQIESTLNKLERFESNPIMYGIFSQPRNSLDFRQIMDEGKILIVKISDHELGPDNAAFIGSFIVWELFQAALSRGTTTSRRQFHLIADEFQRFMTTAFPRIIGEARKFGLDCVVAHQHRDQLNNNAVKGATKSVANKIVFRVNGADAREFAEEFEISVPDTDNNKNRFLDPHPLQHLASRGHQNPRVMEWVREIDRVINDLAQLVSWYVGSWRDSTRYTTLFRARVDDFKGELDSILYAMMERDADVDQFDATKTDAKFDLFRSAFETLYQSVPFSDGEFSNIYDYRKAKFDFYWGRGDNPDEKWEWKELRIGPLHFQKRAHRFEKTIIDGIYTIGRYLHVEPIWSTPPGDTLPTERARLYSDVLMENANALTTLPNYHAHIKFIDCGVGLPEEETIQVYEFDHPLDEERAERIKQASRSYANPRLPYPDRDDTIEHDRGYEDS